MRLLQPWSSEVRCS